MTRAVRLPAAIAEQIVAAAEAAAPNEACGIVIGDRLHADGGSALRFVPTPNAASSPYRFEIEPRALVRLTLETEGAGEVFWAIVHSHVASAARPSATDSAGALDPGAIHLLVGPLDGSSPPELRAWAIPGPGEPARELPLEVES